LVAGTVRAFTPPLIGARGASVSARMPATVWKGHIAFGLVSVPVRLFRAARKETVRLHHVRSEPELDREADPLPSPTPTSIRQALEQQRSPRPSLVESGLDNAPSPAPRVERLRQSLVTPEDRQPVQPEERAKAFEYGSNQ
jgi:DNA end-binding protein Ku